MGGLAGLYAPVSAVPIMCGGLHPKVLDRAGRLCDGWISPGNSTDDFERIRDVVDAARVDAGRCDEAFEYILSGSDPAARDWYRSCGDERVAVQNHPPTFALGPEASLDQRRDALAAFATEAGIAP